MTDRDREPAPNPGSGASPRARRIAAWALAAAGAFVLAAGLFWAGLYVHGVVEVWNEPDRGFLFWGLALLFFGIGLAYLGALMLFAARKLLR